MTEQYDAAIHLLTEAQKAFLLGDHDGYTRCLSDARKRAESEQSDALRGEVALTEWMDRAMDIDAALACLRRANALLNGNRSVTCRNIPLNLGLDSMIGCIFGREDLSAALSKVREAARLYESLTGCGLGFDTLYEAEDAYYRIDLDRAAVLAHQVVYTARNSGQANLAASGAKMLAQIAMHRGDSAGWSYAIHVINAVLHEIEGDIRAHNSINLLRYELSVLLGDFDALPDWMRDGVLPLVSISGVLGLNYKLRDDSIPIFRLPMALWTHTLYLMLSGQYDRALAVDSLQHSMRIDSAVPSLDLYFSQARAICLLQHGDRAQAERILERVVEVVLQEGMLMVIAEFEPLTDGIVENLVRSRDEEAYRKIQTISQQMGVNPRKILETVSGVHAIENLTVREREIALLATDGMSNQQIAEKLCITQQTVKFHLGNVYQKLSVNSRSRMAAVLRNG